MIMGDHVTLTYGGKTVELPLVVGTEGEKAIDISSLRKHTGLITIDYGYANTGSCYSAITYMDGENGILRYRGIPVEQLAEHSTFIETAYLLINGTLPTRTQLNRFSVLLNDNSLVHEDMRSFYEKYPRASHPMGILSSMVNALRSFYPELQSLEEEINITMTRLLSKVRTMAAMSYKISRGHKMVYPRPDLTYCANFLNMMFDTPVKPYRLDGDLVEALNVFWILHADHEQNCSTSAVRVVGSGRVNLYAAISAGIAALWGPLHGGANQAVIEMLKEIREAHTVHAAHVLPTRGAEAGVVDPHDSSTETRCEPGLLDSGAAAPDGRSLPKEPTCRQPKTRFNPGPPPALPRSWSQA